MSRRSGSARAFSAGDAGTTGSGSFCKSAKISDVCGLAGPSGDFTDHSDPIGIIIFQSNLSDSSTTTESEDEEINELKKEYFSRLHLIRQKLETLDIANADYYSRCYTPPEKLTITELTGSDNEEDNDHESRPVSVENNRDISNRCEVYPERQLDETNMKMFDIKLEHQLLDNEIGLQDNIKASQGDIALKFNYRNSILHPSSKEMIEMDYNPPKKKACVRELTPKLAVADGIIPYHIKVSLHEIKKANEKSQKSASGHGDGSRCCQHRETCDKHVVPQIDQVLSGGDFVRRRISDGFPDDVRGDTVKESSQASPSIINTETTVTNDTFRIKKKRRLCMRSADHVGNSVDSRMLSEQIRTMEALNKSKRGPIDSSSSKDSFFCNILMNNENDAKKDIKMCRSLDVPPKNELKKSSSLAKIVNLCSGIFSRDNQNSKTKLPMSSKRKHHDMITVAPAPINNFPTALLELPTKQELDLISQPSTLSDENFSEVSFSEEDFDEIYEPCFFCFCFGH